MFGDVFLAKAASLVEGKDEQLVYVKSLLAREENVQIEFRAEVEMFHKLQHDRICKLLALCKEVEPIYAVLEYCEWVCVIVNVVINVVDISLMFLSISMLQGDLKQFLLATSATNTQQLTIDPPNESQKITMCHQVLLADLVYAQRYVVYPYMVMESCSFYSRYLLPWNTWQTADLCIKTLRLVMFYLNLI